MDGSYFEPILFLSGLALIFAGLGIFALLWLGLAIEMMALGSILSAVSFVFDDDSPNERLQEQDAKGAQSKAE